MNPSNQPLSDCHQAPMHVQTANEGTSCYICTECTEVCDLYVADQPEPKPDAQAELLAFASDPKTIAKAAEGSMDKRLAVLDAQAEVGLREKIMQLLPHGPCQCNLGKECVSDTNYYADQLTALFQADKAAAVRAALRTERTATLGLSNPSKIDRALAIAEQYGYERAIKDQERRDHLARLQPPTAGEGESV